MWTLDDVIAAVASPAGSAARGIVRVAGPEVRTCVAPLLDRPEVLEVRRATRRSARMSVQGLNTPLPVDLFIWPDHRCYVGQPTIEIHTIGSPPILNAIVETLGTKGVRIARPGEFTLRAFLSGKIDLVQAEAVLGVIDADSTERLQQALTQLAGGVSSRILELREQLLIDLADLEAGLDFVEEDIEFVDREAMTARLHAGIDWLQQLEQQARQRGQTTGRKTVVLAGLPNAGKSTLFNALAGRPEAVVSNIAGTTRDWLTTRIELPGGQIEIVDTAGAEEGRDDIMSDAQSARLDRIKQADLVLWCTAADATPEEQADNAHRRDEAHAVARGWLELITKDDQSTAPDTATGPLRVSASTGQGLDELKARLARELTDQGDQGELITSTLARCSESLTRAHESLSLAARYSAAQAGEELVAMELRRGIEALGQIAGVVYTDDLLDRIFSRFCIGK